MKKAVLVVGPHFSGKSKTICKYFKPLVGISGRQRIFTLHNKSGTALSQSTEERKLGYVLSQSTEERRLLDLQDFLDRYLGSHWLVLAARPCDEPGSNYDALATRLKKSGFSVHTVIVKADQSDAFYRQRGKDILAYLS